MPPRPRPAASPGAATASAPRSTRPRSSAPARSTSRSPTWPSSLTAARDGIRALGGYIGASATESDGESPIASVTYRIPVERWEDALDLLRGISGPGTKVVAERTDAVEVTGQIVDLEARIKNLRASETALQAIAAEAVRVSDVLEVQAQLTQVRGEIEQLTAQLANLENQTSYATLTATYRAPVVAVDVAQGTGIRGPSSTRRRPA